MQNAARLLLVGAIAIAAAASAKQQTAPPPQGPSAAPAPVAMAPDAALGLWKSNFGPVKIARDPRGSSPEEIHGVWSYLRGEQPINGLFWGRLRGNVLDFRWDEPGVNGPLQGEGYIQFSPDGSRFDGQWWTGSRDRSGAFTAERAGAAAPAAPPAPPTYGGADPYGVPYGAPPPPPY